MQGRSLLDDTTWSWDDSRPHCSPCRGSTHLQGERYSQLLEPHVHGALPTKQRLPTASWCFDVLYFLCLSPPLSHLIAAVLQYYHRNLLSFSGMTCCQFNPCERCDRLRKYSMTDNFPSHRKPIKTNFPSHRKHSVSLCCHLLNVPSEF